ncbi:MAG: trypsin-like peptidase domain-containing protein [Phycisphaerales bacterium]
MLINRRSSSAWRTLGPAALALALLHASALAQDQSPAPADPAKPAATTPPSLPAPVPAITPEQAALDADDFLERLNASTRRIVAAVEPSVVHVALEAKMPGFRRTTPIGAGSGWVWSWKDGTAYVVTNQHVVDTFKRIVVQTQDGRRILGDVVGADKSTDIAVIKFQSDEPLVPARRATGNTPQRGDRVYAFGSPFGYKFSMSEGVVSGLSRELPGDSRNTLTNYIQSDTSVNPGNSGGILVDIRGRVVGMNVAIATAPDEDPVVRGNERISFAIPLSTIEPVVDQLIATGTVAKGFLGINFPVGDDANQVLLDRAAFRGPGVSVTGVLVGSPAEIGGVRSGDIVTRVNRAEVLNIAALRSLIAVTRPGEAITLTVVREGKPRDVTITLIDREANQRAMSAVEEALPRIGLMRIAGVDEGEGVVVAVVRAGSPADRAGVKQGVTITAIEGKPINNGDTFVSALVAAGFVSGNAIRVTFKPEDGPEKTVTLRLPGEDPPVEK